MLQVRGVSGNLGGGNDEEGRATNKQGIREEVMGVGNRRRGTPQVRGESEGMGVGRRRRDR